MLQNLQALRAVAALLVVVHHFLLANRDSGVGGVADFLQVAEFGACGVDLFFCISGFVMLGSIIRDGTFDPKGFMLGRIIRIVPLYWLALTLFLGLVVVANVAKMGWAGAWVHPWFSWDLVTFSYLLIPAYNPVSQLVRPVLAQGWTLSYEFYFYGILMIAVFLARANLLKTLGWGAILLSAGVALPAELSGRAVLDFLRNPVALEFLFGMLIFIATKKTRHGAMVCMILGVVALLATAGFKIEDRTRLLFWGVPSALILYGAVALEGQIKLPAVLKNLGDASYSLYLTHGFLTYIYVGLLKQGFWASAAAKNTAASLGILLSMILALACYRWIEKPLIVGCQKRWLPAKRRPQP